MTTSLGAAKASWKLKRSDEWTTVVVPKDGLKDTWSVVSPLLASAISYSGGRISLGSVYQSISKGEADLWVVYRKTERVIRAAIVTSTRIYPRKSMFSVDLLGGVSLRAWVGDVFAIFVDFAERSGLAGIECYGRPGWERILQPYGWRRAAVLCEVAVSHKERVDGQGQQHLDIDYDL